MKKVFSLKYKFIFIHLFLVIMPLLLVLMTVLNQCNHYSTIGFSIIIAVSIVVAVIIGLLVSRSIIKVLRKVVEFLKQVSEGDLAVKLDIKRSDEFGEMMQFLNTLVMNQRQLIKLSHLRKLETPIIEIDKEFNLTFVNDSFCKLTQTSPDECIGKKCYDMMKTDSCQTPNCFGSNAMSQKRNIHSEFRAEFVGFKTIPVNATYIPLENNGVVEGTICCIVDQADIYEIIDEVRIVTNSLDESSEHFESLSQQLNASANEIDRYSDQSRECVMQISNSGEDIANHIDQEVMAIKEMRQSLLNISDITNKAKDISLNASEKSQEITYKMDSMAQTSEEISKTIFVIDEIADRTDLLALNAAIEAESAGSAGKGFAVVADEVQKLAKQSSDATNEITRQIANVEKSTKDAQHDMEIIHSIISEITTFNTEIANAVEILNQTVTKVLDSVENTEAKASAIADGVSQSFQIANDIANVSKESVGIAENTSNASQKMTSLVANLMEVLSRFKI